MNRKEAVVKNELLASTAMLPPSYGGEAVLLHQKIKEAISMIMIFKQDTRISLHR
mgnify:CR=1 FL=1